MPRGCPLMGERCCRMRQALVQTLVASANARLHVMSCPVSAAAAEEGHVTPPCTQPAPWAAQNLSPPCKGAGGCFDSGLEILPLVTWAGGEQPCKLSCNQHCRGRSRAGSLLLGLKQALTVPSGTQQVTVSVTAPRTWPAQWHQFAGKELRLGWGPEAVSTDRYRHSVQRWGPDPWQGGDKVGGFVTPWHL